MDSFASVIDRWGSLKAFAADVGVNYGHAQVMRHRNSIDSRHWFAVVEAAKVRGYSDVSYERLARLAAQPKAARTPQNIQSALACAS